MFIQWSPTKIVTPTHWNPDKPKKKRPHPLCNRPAVFFLHLPLTSLPLLKKKSAGI